MDQRDGLQFMVSSSGIEGKKGVHGNDICIPNYLLQVRSSALQYGTEHLPKVMSELIPLFHWLVHTNFASPIKISLSSSMSPLAFIVFSFWPSGKGIEQGAGWVLDR